MTMTVKAIGQNQDSCIYTIVKSTAVGTAGGYAMKYLWPIVKQEETISKRDWVNFSRKQANAEKVKMFQSYKKMTPAQDAFVKMIDADKGSKVKTSFSPDNISSIIKKLGGEDSVAGKELKAIIKTTNDAAHNLAKDLIINYRRTLKSKRPVIPFLVAGAGIGFIAGFMHNVAKTDV